jgi:deazaflavin-dependent oxidoreductase (nitroreductase family)
MDDVVRHALATERTVDITTIGRRSGLPRRIEIWFHNVDGDVYITGLPSKRDWYANVLADPSLTLHLKQSVIADLAATAVSITDPDEKRRLLTEIRSRLRRHQEVDDWVMESPLIRIDFD